jgi:hypothetical protein
MNDDEHDSYSTIRAAIFAVTVVLALLILSASITTQTAMKNGYVQGTIPGHNGVVWVKP